MKPITTTVLFSLFIIGLATPAFAQVRVGILGGIHQSEVLEENDLPNFDEFRKGYSRRTGAHFGLIADMPFSPKSNLYFQPAVIFFNKGRKYSDSINAPSGPVYVTSEQFLNYIDVPLNLVYKFGKKKVKFIVGAGPYVSFWYNGKEKTETLEQGVLTTEENTDLSVGKGPGYYKVLTYGANALAGIEIGSVFLTANYSRGLHSFYEAKDYDGTFKHQLFGATFGIYFAKLNPPSADNKPKDFDNDGIPDATDACPEAAGTAVTNGCPDKDADGIADKDDKCPDTPGLAALNGCPPVDTDKDGVNDDTDKCPTVAGTAKYNGCPVPDSDNDGINNELDKCPAVPGSAKYNGCPVPDSDGDGIDDESDKCPAVKGVKEKDGCPEEVKKEIIEKVNYAAKKIQFEFSKATLVSSSYAVLDEVVTILKANPDLKIAIEGHTSADGIYDANMRLSQARADNVKAYFVSKGIDASRISSKGFGSNQPLNKGKTEAEKAANRRVEMKLSQ
ncbi:MAG TPA: OmpA family protein [Chitinophagaceae bacterium]|jgi:outer membrane protein OmpA-like peptidoglycan-associated protein|nr:OmpA family protein [Chitinophagaceae bacterium]